MTPELRRALEICINAAMAEADSLAEVARHSAADIEQERMLIQESERIHHAAAEVQAFIDGGKA